MRQILLCVISILFLAPTLALSQNWSGAEFDARGLTSQEKRVLQAALALSGDYVGLFDGDWGKGSQRALEAYTLHEFGTDKPRFSHLRPVLAAWAVELRESGWETYYYNSTDTSYAHPSNFLIRTDDPDTIQFDASDGSFSLVIHFADFTDTYALHQYFLNDAVFDPEPYQTLTPDRLITAVTLENGLVTYARSDRIKAGYVTLSIIATAGQKARMAILAGSMQRGRAADLMIPSHGALAELMAATPDQNVMAQPAIPPPPAASTITGSGTGFYINNTDLLTAAHVVEGCAGLTLADGTSLSVIADDTDLDLALVSGTRRSARWLELNSDVAPRLGEPVMALGFPYLGTLGQGLTVTGGNVSAMQGINGTSDRIMISAPVQPGNSGGPLLNGAGAVIGVVVARVNDLNVLKETGTLPQNMNFAVPTQPLISFLDASGVFYPRAQSIGTSITSGIPAEISDAVVPIFCNG